MTAAREGNRVGGVPHVDADEIIKSARRRRRAADSRRRALLGDADAAVVDGSAALQPAVEPLVEPETEPLEPRRREPRQPKRRTAVRQRPRTAPAPVAAPRAPFVLSVLGLIAAGIVGLLLLNTAINENAFILQDLREDQSALDVTEQEVTDELAELSAPGNLAAAAERLGLEPAEDITYVRLPDGKELKMPTPGGN
ncbi:MAG: hypothetical protein ACRDXX_12030 [Stackebrandtia sp.]